MSTTCPRFIQITAMPASNAGAYLLALDESGRVWHRAILFQEPNRFRWEIFPNDSESWDGRRTTEAKK